MLPWASPTFTLCVFPLPIQPIAAMGMSPVLEEAPAGLRPWRHGQAGHAPRDAAGSTSSARTRSYVDAAGTPKLLFRVRGCLVCYTGCVAALFNNVNTQMVLFTVAVMPPFLLHSRICIPA
jgi:hypothetical protein